MNLRCTILLLASLASVALAAKADAAGGADEHILSAGRQAELINLLKHDCGACHGLHMTGGLGPPLRPADLLAKAESALVNAVLAGRAGTPMPPWRGLLTEAEARWMVRYLRGMKL